MIPYNDLIGRKRVAFEPRGLAKVPSLNPKMFEYQHDVTEFMLRCGCGGAFLATGLGKSLVALEWARVIVEATNKSALMLAPLAVGPQHEREAAKFGIEAKYVREPHEIKKTGILITNYERVHKFDAGAFGAVIVDESSIMKSFTGATTRQLMELFAKTPYRLACSATPAPNDHMELGQQSQFLGIMDSNEMLARWFISDQTQMGRYRLKKPAVKHYWDWIASWARAMARPSDLGYSDEGFELPPLNMNRCIVKADLSVDVGEEKSGQGRLFRVPDTSATSIHKEKRLTASARAEQVANIVGSDGAAPWLIWVETDYEADAVRSVLPEAVEVRGSMPAEKKEERLVGFTEGSVRVLLTKPGIAGFGLNWQHCNKMVFAGLNFSFEQFHQAVRRCWRFGQTQPVDAHVVMSDTEEAIWNVVARKAGDHEQMQTEMRDAMRRATRRAKVLQDYEPKRNVAVPSWLVSL